MKMEERDPGAARGVVCISDDAGQVVQVGETLAVID